MPQNNTHVEETLHPNKTRFNNSNNPNSSISINNGDPKAILINTQLSHLNQLNHLSHANRVSSTSSSYTSTTSPSNFTSFSYNNSNSPSVQPPVSLSLQRNSLSSRSGSIENLSNSIPNGILIPPPTQQHQQQQHQQHQQQQQQQPQPQLQHSLSFNHSYTSSITPAGRRSLLTSKLKEESLRRPHQLPQFQKQHQLHHLQQNQLQHQQLQLQQAYQQQQQYHHHHHQQQQRQQQQQQQQYQEDTQFPTPARATATTNVSKDLVFSTNNSSNSTLYQDAPTDSSFSTGRSNVGNLSQNINHQFLSVSAPAHAPIHHQHQHQHQQLQQQEQTLIPPPNYQSHHEPESTKSINIAEFPPNDLLVMLSALLQKIIEANDILHTDGNLNPVIPSSSVNATSTSSSFSNETTHLFNDKYNANVMAFRGRNIPAISIYSYLKRIIKYCPATNDVFLSLLVYFDRIAKRANNTVHTQEDAIMQDDTTESPSESPFQVFVMDSYNIHRLIIAGVIVASKFLSDVFYKNSRYAKVGGLPLEELNHLELQFLLLLDFQLMIQKEELEKYAELLSRFWKRQQLQQQQQQQQQQQPQQPPPT
ncbi:hypothetical protein PP714_08790 [Lacticaseibacillus paracasei]|nr:hypothetical protein [Lacticaseibacillus paracasei]